MTAPRVLHIVENLDRGAVENWLVRMLRHARAAGQAPDWTFYCALGVPGALDHEARALGARILYSPVPVSRKIAFARALRDEIRNGRYDVIHAHHDLVSGLYMAAAAGLPPALRLVHAHNADEIVLTPNPLKQALLRGPLRRTGLAMADRILGISNHTLDTYLAGRPRRVGRDVVHYYGVDPAPFRDITVNRTAFRRALGLADDALILLFGGRLVPEKNPVFAVDVLAALRAREPRAVLVYAGAGSEEAAIVPRAAALGVSDSVRLLGWRSDLPHVMAQADWFILPRPEHPMEGFGLAVVEAQLAGLRMLLSRGISDDPLLPTASYRRLGLAEAPDAWADAAMALLQEPAPSREAALAALTRSPFDMDTALAHLNQLHTA
jgi:glycosyltransferase involved in cell wall biosynthesis